MEPVQSTARFSLGIVGASVLLFLALVLLGTPVLGVPVALALLGWSLVRYAPETDRIRFAFLALVTAGLAGVVVPLAVYESDWTASLDGYSVLVVAVTGALAVLWAGVEVATRLGPKSA